MRKFTEHTEKARPFMRRLLASGAVLLATAGALIGLGVPHARALGLGEACAFIEPQGAAIAGQNFGHIGWGYQVAGTSTWVFGATENPNGSAFIQPGDFNGAWKATGTWDDMLDAFTSQTYYPSHAVNPASNSNGPSAPYTSYKCEIVANSAVGAANNAAAATFTAGYLGLTNDCLTAVISVLSAYNAQNLNPATDFGPNYWYDNLSASAWNITGTLGIA
jgi:hypothetical protein